MAFFCGKNLEKQKKGFIFVSNNKKKEGFMKKIISIVLGICLSVVVYSQDNDNVLNHDLELWDCPSSHVGITIDHTDTVLCVFDGATIRTYPIIAVDVEDNLFRILVLKNEQLAIFKVKDKGNKKGYYWNDKGKRYKVVKLQ